MIKSKNKICILCGREDQPHFSKKRCKKCSQKSYSTKEIKRVPIPKVSVKRKKENVDYLKLRLQFLNEHQKCEVKKLGCSIYATEIHHQFSGKDRQKYYLNTNTWLAICRNCHNWIHSFSKEARELGLLK